MVEKKELFGAKVDRVSDQTMVVVVDEVAFNLMEKKSSECTVTKKKSNKNAFVQRHRVHTFIPIAHTHHIITHHCAYTLVCLCIIRVHHSSSRIKFTSMCYTRERRERKVIMQRMKP